MTSPSIPTKSRVEAETDPAARAVAAVMARFPDWSPTPAMIGFARAAAVSAHRHALTLRQVLGDSGPTQDLPLHQGIEDSDYTCLRPGVACASPACVVERRCVFGSATPEGRVSRREQIARLVEPWAMNRAECDPESEELRDEAYAKADAIMALPHTVRAEPVAWDLTPPFGEPRLCRPQSDASKAGFEADGWQVQPLYALPQDPDPLIGAVDDFLIAYRAKFAKPSTSGVRSSAPLRREAGEMAIALDKARGGK